MSVCCTHIVIVWNCALLRSQLPKTAVVCDKCPSHMPGIEMNMCTHQIHYNGGDTKDAENS